MAGVVSGVSAQAGKWMKIDYTSRTLESYGQRAVAGAAGAMAGAAVRSAIAGTGFGDNIMATLPDVIASTIGNMIAYGVEAKAPESEDAIIVTGVVPRDQRADPANLEWSRPS